MRTKAVAALSYRLPAFGETDPRAALLPPKQAGFHSSRATMESHECSRRVFLKRGTALTTCVTACSLRQARADVERRSISAEEFAKHDGIALAELVRQKEVTPDELLGIAIARAEAVDPQINAIAGLLKEEARESIRAGLPDGPFRGVPILLKDISFAMAGVDAEFGSVLFRGHKSAADSIAVSRYRKSGVVMFGRTRVPELGILPTTESTLGGVTRNPFHLDRTAGGSSGGSAAAVAAGIAPMATASDGGGSIRIPASCCGVFGLKPTRARIPIGPETFESWGGLGTLHAVTRSVRDSAALLDVASGPAIGDSYHAPHHAGRFLDDVAREPEKLKVALVTTMPPATKVDPECSRAVDAAAKLCESLGHIVEHCTDDFAGRFEFEKLRHAHGVTVLVAIRQTVLARLRQLRREIRDGDLEPVTRYYFDVAADYTAVELQEARATFFRAARTMGSFQQKYDVILSPTLATPPIEHGKITLTGWAKDVVEGLLRFNPCTPLANWTGQPAMTVPLYQTEDGIPIGIQFYGRFGDESTLFQLAGQLERALPWKNRSPQL